MGGAASMGGEGPAGGGARPRPKSPPLPAPAPPPVAAAAPPLSVRREDTPPGERVALQRQRCPKLACVADLSARHERWASLGVAEMRAFTVDLEACRRACGSR
jgi:hypothetical protein